MTTTVEAALALADTHTHLARCPVCDFRVSYIPSESGNSYALVDADPELALGIGSNGRPVCRNGEHGEMELADDQLAQPEQQSLPGIVQPFNYEGAYLELEAKAVEVEHLAAIHAEDASRAKGSRKNWESAAAVFSSMALEFRRRRRAKVDQAGAADSESEPPLFGDVDVCGPDVEGQAADDVAAGDSGE